MFNKIAKKRFSFKTPLSLRGVGRSVLPLFLGICLLLGAAGTAGAFSVDVKNIYYYDQFDVSSPMRTINYGFSAGTLSSNTIVIPDSFVTKKSADAGLTFVFTPYPDPSNYISVALDTAGSKATLSTDTNGGCVIASTPSLPNIASAAPGWTWAVQLSNFTGITDPAKAYRAQIGFGSTTTTGPHPELTAQWRTGGVLEIKASFFDDTGNGTTIWSSSTVDLSDLNPSSLGLQIRRPLPPNAYQMIFEYSLNGGAWTQIATYDIPTSPVDQRPLQFGFPAKFPFVSLRVESLQQQDPFQVSSQHWKDAQGNGHYNAWPRVMDPGTSYSAVTLNSPGYLAETPLAYNSAAGYWSLSGTLFSDDFNDNAVDTAKWTTAGTSVTESGGQFKVDQAATDAGGKALSRTIVINPYAPITVQRKAKVHSANIYFDGLFALYFGDTADFASGFNLNAATMSVIVSHANYDITGYTLPNERSVNGFYLGRYPAHFISDVVRTDPVWDTEFVEKIIYNPVTGIAELYINDELKATINVGALPATARYMNVFIQAWGWYTGHYNYSDDLTVSQPWTGGTVFLSANTPPASFPVFNFTATKQAGGTDPVSKTITGYVETFATNLAPTGNITTATPTFSWTGISGATSYSVQVSDANGNRIWNKYAIPGGTTSAVYNDDGKGPALVSGQTYKYEIVSTIVTGGVSNDSFAQGSFTYTAEIFKGDLDGNGVVNLADTIIAMKVLSGLTPTIRANYATSGADVNGDGQVGLQEGLYILQRVAGLRDALNVWHPRTPAVSGTSTFFEAIAGPSGFLIGGQGTIQKSLDGVTWYNSNISPNSDNFLGLAGAADGALFAAGRFGLIIKSADVATTWTASKAASSAGFMGIAAGNGKIVAVGYDSGTNRRAIIFTSADGGANWSEMTPAGVAVNSYEGITFGNGKFVVVGYAFNGSAYTAVILTSTDGSTWTAANVTAQAELRGVTWGGGKFVAVGIYGAILTSPDGSNWAVQNSGITDKNFNQVGYSSGFYVIAGQSGTLLTSPDGMAWTARPSGTTKNLEGVAFGKNTFLVVGGDSNSPIILQSDPL